MGILDFQGLFAAFCSSTNRAAGSITGYEGIRSWYFIKRYCRVRIPIFKGRHYCWSCLRGSTLLLQARRWWLFYTGSESSVLSPGTASTLRTACFMVRLLCLHVQELGCWTNILQLRMAASAGGNAGCLLSWMYASWNHMPQSKNSLLSVIFIL